MAPHSSALAWKIPWMEEPGGLQSIGSQGVGHDWATSLSPFIFMHWRRKWQPAPVFLPGESQGRGNLVGCCLWGRRVGHDWSDLAAAAAVGSCYIAQGAHLGALWWPRGVGWERGGSEAKEGGDICIYQLTHFVVQQKLMQHCKAFYSNKKKKTVLLDVVSWLWNATLFASEATRVLFPAGF